jgi:hypothetical protein
MLSFVTVVGCSRIGLFAQNLDSLLRNKRVYYTENIGELPAPKIDGILVDEIWEKGEWHGNFTQQQPNGGADGTENTYVKVLYDKSNLFVAIVCQDSEPDLIWDVFDRRDALSGDMTGIAIDSYFDKRTAFEFNLSAAGQKIDLKHLGDYEWYFNWDAVWDGATSKNDTAWVAEMRIPFSQIRYSNSEEQIWGMHVWRWISRKFEEDQWQYIPKEAPAMVYLFGELKGVRNIRSSRQIEFLPYALGSLERLKKKEVNEGLSFNGGIDAKVGISSDYTLDLSINPDFGQVEADPSVLNLTSFETFYEEKRPFFLEGNEIFDFQMDKDIPYYSRRVGSAPVLPDAYSSWEVSDVPNRTTILGAAKLTGKSRKGLSLGIVNGLTAEEYATANESQGSETEIQVAPLSNFHASRLKKELKEGNTIVGGMFSLVNRISSDSALQQFSPSRALSGGIDLMHYWDNKNYYVEMISVASQLSGSPEAILRKQLSHTHRFQRPDADYLDIDSTLEQLVGHGGLFQVGKKGGKFNFNLLGQYRSPGLNLNDLGYIRQADFVGQKAEITYNMNDPGKWVRNYTITVHHEAQWSFGGENTMQQLGATFSLMNIKLWRFMFSYGYDFNHLDIRELRGGPALRLDGEHSFTAFISSNRTKKLSGRAGLHSYLYGEPGYHRELLYVGVTWLPVRKLKLSGITTFDRRHFYQQYVKTIPIENQAVYLVSDIDHRSTSLTFRGEVFLTPELSLQYYGSPYYAVGDYEEFKRIDRPNSKDVSDRLSPIDVQYDQELNHYSVHYVSETQSFENPDFSFMQFRSNLVFRWEYKLGSTLYLVWAHDRSGWESNFYRVSDITGDLFGIKGNNVIMFKLNFWFSI